MENNRKYIPDSRFAGMKKEARFTALFWALYFLGVMGTAYFLGKGNPADYTYILGFPVWFAATIGVTVIFIILGVYVLKYRFQNVPLDAEDPAYDYTLDQWKEEIK